MKLSKDEIALLRSLVEWRRASGWTLERYDFTYVSPDRKTEFWPGWGKELGDRMFITYPQPELGKPRERVIPPCLSLREAVDVLVAFGLLSVEFSSAFAAGRESAYTRDEWRVMAVNPDTGQETVNGPADERRGRALLTVAHTFDSDARLEHRRTGATEWETVEDVE